jgi:hypothetical protein
MRSLDKIGKYENWVENGVGVSVGWYVGDEVKVGVEV